MENDSQEHPSFGLLQFNRISGVARFFGSELAHDSYIKMTVSEAVVERKYNQEWYYQKSNIPILQVRLTNLQFAELITSMNMNSGIPVTIERTEKGIRPSLPDKKNAKEEFEDDTKKTFEELTISIKESVEKAKNILENSKLNKRDREGLFILITSILQEFESNMPFALKNFQEATNRIITEAKIEVEGAIQHKLTTLGLESLHQITKSGNQEIRE